MVRRVGLDTRPADPERATTDRGRRALGGRGQAILDRLFGGSRDAARRTTAEPATVRDECPVIAVGSGKGGTGKSFLTTSLAVELERLGHRTVIVDCDFGLACAHLLLDAQPTRHLRHLVTGEAQLDEVVVRTSIGARLVPGVTGVRQMADLSPAQLSVLGTAVGELAADADIVLLDCGAGLTPQICAFLAAADQVLLVAQPELAALTDAYAVVKTLTQLRAEPDVAIVVNRVQEREHGATTFGKLAEVSQRHAGVTLRFCGAIADDPEVTHKRLGQLPLVATDPERPVCVHVRAVADELARIAAPLRPRRREPRAGFADRLADQGRIC